ncbi:MAG: outer membrane protein assembly factor BamC [Pseudomonadota bacterium]
MRNAKSLALLLAGLTLLSSCGFATYDRRELYLDAETIDRVKIPATLDEPAFEDAMPIPEVDDLREIAGQRLELGLPEPLSTSFGVDQIVIKRLGDSRWVFVDTAPASVWPRVRQFFTDNNIEIAVADPARGVIETDWIAAASGDARAVFDAIKRGRAFAATGADTRYKFRLRVESGVRSGSTEVFLEQKQLPLSGPLRTDNPAWTGISDNGELEAVVLSDLAYFLGDRINTGITVSRMAATIGGEKTELVLDRFKPVLKYRLPFDRAWVTVGDALENARISVEDLNRDDAVYYVYFDDTTRREPGFFSRLFAEKDKVAGAANRYLVQLDNKDAEVHVTVLKDASNLADASVAEKLLKIIKQYST